MADAPDAGQEQPEGEEATTTVVVDLSPQLRDLRDHITAAHPDLVATAYRGELTLQVTPARLLDVLDWCRTDPTTSAELLSDLHAVHWPGGVEESNDQETTGWPTTTVTNAEGRIEVDYILRSVTRQHWFRLRTAVPEDAPALPSATAAYTSANVMEREVYDLMGVVFEGHPNMSRIMMPDDWEGHPHRKDYPLGGVEVMYKGHTVPPPDERDY